MSDGGAPTGEAPADGGAIDPAMATIDITLNGEARQVSADLTVAALIAEVSGPGGKVAVEINREIVPRSTHGERTLVAGDAVEIVTFVGGG